MLDDDELALIWQQAEQFRQETSDTILALKADSAYCPDCYSRVDPLVWTTDGDDVCSGCGLVLGSSRVSSGEFEDRARCIRSIKAGYVGYKHIFHFNERVANLALDDPVLPDDIFDLIQAEHWRGYRSDGKTSWGLSLDYADVRAILRAVVVPYQIAEKYTGKRYKKLPLENLEQKFSERWLTIRYRLTNERPEPLSELDRCAIRKRFMMILAPFQYLRHKSECDRSFKCHKKFGCAYKLPPYNFIIKELLFVYKKRELLDKYEKYLLHTTSAPSLAKIRRLWDQIAFYNNWETSYGPSSPR